MGRPAQAYNEKIILSHTDITKLLEIVLGPLTRKRKSISRHTDTAAKNPSRLLLVTKSNTAH